MSDKKNIDRLFQEKFKDFEAVPNANVWAGIQSKMDRPQEKTKVVFPVWLRFAGIAAALILLLAVGNLVFNNENTINNTTVIDSKNSSDNENAINNSKNNNTVGTVSNENINTSEVKNNHNINNENESINNATVVTSKNDSKSNNASEIYGIKVNNLSTQSSYVKGVSKENNENVNTSLVNKINRNAIGDHVNSEKQSVLNESNSMQRATQSSLTNKPNNNVPNNNSSNTLANNTNVENRNAKNTNVAANQNKTNTKASSALKNNSTTSDTVVVATNSEKEKEEGKQMEPDSANSSNAIDEALAKNEDLDEKEEEIVNRWSVNANAAPVYYNTLGKGSHIHDQFIDNPKNGEVNTSYGINVGYALNDKLKVRSGINKLNLSYDTANVIVYENVTNTPSIAPLRNINFVPTNQGQNISVLSANSLSIQQISSVINDDLNAALSQRLSYLEVPLELEYAVVKNRFGLHLIGGFSTFFLNNNEVVTEVDNRKTKIGEANNINNISFSANAGIGIDYKFNDAIKFNLEPTFKYQINAYNETSGNFKPYIIGVYTGISYKF